MTRQVSMWRAFALFAFAYAISYALRAVNAAIGPEVATEFALDAAFLGGMTAAYFAAFALVQWPLGGWLDRLGPIRTECSLLLIAALGCFVFALAGSAAWLVAGRALIGAGVAACLMAPYKAYRSWFAPHWQGRLVSWMLFAGTLGAMLAASPAQWLTQQIGWRAVFAGTGAAMLLAAAGLWLGLPREKPAKIAGHVAKPLLVMLKEPAVMNFAPAAILAAGGFIAVQTLWLGPWMRAVHGMSAPQAAAALTAMNGVMLIGFLLCGSIAPWLNARFGWMSGVTFGAFTLSGLTLALAAALGASGPWGIWMLVGLLFTVQPLAQSRVTLAFAPADAGRASTATNLLIFGGAFVLQWGIGAGIELLGAAGLSRVDAFRACFGLLGLATAAAGVWGLVTAQRAYLHRPGHDETAVQ
jgi:predicted MFS family arabinose efflux permease